MVYPLPDRSARLGCSAAGCGFQRLRSEINSAGIAAFPCTSPSEFISGNKKTSSQTLAGVMRTQPVQELRPQTENRVRTVRKVAGVDPSDVRLRALFSGSCVGRAQLKGFRGEQVISLSTPTAHTRELALSLPVSFSGVLLLSQTHRRPELFFYHIGFGL